MGSHELRDDEYALQHAVRGTRDGWWWPVVDTHAGTVGESVSPDWNDVTFLRRDEPGEDPAAVVEVVGSFAALHERFPLRRVLDRGSATPWRAVTVRVRRAAVFRYVFLVAGVRTLDPVNPQRTRTDDGSAWSRFSTDACAVLLELDRAEHDLLSRLVTRLLPFRARGAEILLDGIATDPRSVARSFPRAELLDEDVGVVNGIDKVLARTERHRAADYHVALDLIGHHLRARFGGTDPAQCPVAAYDDVLAGLAAGTLDGWPPDARTRPDQFGRLLRRHAVTAAFAHPRHGGNVDAQGWRYLEDRYVDAVGNTAFAWRRAVEKPLGSSAGYRG